MTTILALQNMTKSYGARTVLDQVSLQLPTGQLLGLIGPSGSGKSTVIKLALGMTQADTGEAYIFETWMPNRKALAQIGYMAQNDALYETLTGYDNLKFFAQMRDIKAIDHEIVQKTKDYHSQSASHKAHHFAPCSQFELTLCDLASASQKYTLRLCRLVSCQGLV